MCNTCRNPKAPSLAVDSGKLFDQIDQVVLIAEDEGVFDEELLEDEKLDLQLPLMTYWKPSISPTDYYVWTGHKNIYIKFAVDAINVSTDGYRTTAHLILTEIIVTSDPKLPQNVNYDSLRAKLKKVLNIPVS